MHLVRVVGMVDMMSCHIVYYKSREDFIDITAYILDGRYDIVSYRVSWVGHCPIGKTLLTHPIHWYSLLALLGGAMFFLNLVPPFLYKTKSSPPPQPHS